MKFTPGQPGGGGQVLPDGQYPFEVTDAQEKVSESSGNDMLAVTHKIKDGPTVYDYLVLNSDAAWKLTNFLASIGYPIKPGQPIDFEPDELLGKRGECILYTDTYQGKKRNKVADYVTVISGPGASGSAPAANPPKDKWR
jgi:hypothetical protein